MKIVLHAAAAALVFCMSGPAFAEPGNIAAAVADTTRPKDDRDTDAARKPADTIAFAGVTTGMVVGELFPGGGYYTRMLSDVVGPTGKIYALETTRWKGSVEADNQMAAGHPNIIVQGTPFGAFNLPEKVDVFWITQNYHDLHIAEYGLVDMAAFNRHVFDSLKPGGTYFILDHAANPGLADGDIAKLHRIEKSRVIKEVTAAGFVLVAENDALHNPADDHTKPIFDASIRGHTDQYMLKFRKP